MGVHHSKISEYADNLPVFILEIFQERVVSVNFQSLVILGIKHASDILGRRIIDYISQEDFERILNNSKLMSETCEVASPFEITLSRPDGATMQCWATAGRKLAESKETQTILLSGFCTHAFTDKESHFPPPDDDWSLSQMLSHDLRAPLRGILGLISFIDEDLQDRGDAEVRNNIELLKEEARRMSALIDVVARYARFMEKEVELKELDLQKITESIIERFADCRCIKFHCGHNFPTIRANPAKVEFVFCVLIDNAVKYMNKLSGDIAIECFEKSRYWEISIKDNGPGILKDRMDSLYRIQYYYDESLGACRFQSNLAIAKKIIEMQGGELFIESAFGLGTTVRFTFSKLIPGYQHG